MKVITYDGLKSLVRSIKSYTQTKITNEINNLDLKKYVTQDQFTDSIDTTNVVFKGNVATINGKSLLEGGNIEIDSSVFKIVTALPATNIQLDKIYLLKSSSSTATRTDFDEWKYEDDEWINLGPFGSVAIDMSQYLSKKEADARYMVKSSNENSSLIVLDNGQVNNLGNNGQAFNGIRQVAKQYYDTPTGSGYPINCASFGVKQDGTTAFSHKKYDSYTYDKSTNTDKTTGAKNTAVLVFSGKSGLLYAKNTGTANDVTTAMYRRVGVIDSPDSDQKVYSCAQTDAQIDTLVQRALSTIVKNFNDQINELKTRIEDLENQNGDLYNKVTLLMAKCDISAEELESMGQPRGFGFSMIDAIQKETDDVLTKLPDTIKSAIEEVTTDYSIIPDEPIDTEV